MDLLPLRLLPGVDLRRFLEEAVASELPEFGLGSRSAFVVAGIGSLAQCRLRFAGEAGESALAGPLEILGIAGTLSASGAHLHMSVSDASGRVQGGHVGYGNIVRTTAELLLAPLEGWSLSREHDAATGFDELVIRRGG